MTRKDFDHRDRTFAAGAGRSVVVGVDVGGSTMTAIVVDAGLRVLARGQAATGAGDPVEQIARVVEKALAEAGRSAEDLDALGVGVPGQVEVESGVVALAVNLAWPPLPLGPRLAARLGVRCVVENDVRAAAAGLAWRSTQGRQLAPLDLAPLDLAYLSVGTGIAAGVVLEGRLYRGRHGLAGEIGHFVVEPAGPACRCGLVGCLEAVASGPAIARQAADAVAAGRLTRLRDRPAPSARDVFEAAAAGDPVATEIADRVGRHLARAVHLLAMTYDVDRIAIGGGVAAAGSPFIEPIGAELERLRRASPLVRRVLPPEAVELIPPEADIGPWGAVALVLAGVGPAQLPPSGTSPSRSNPGATGPPPSTSPARPSGRDGSGPEDARLGDGRPGGPLDGGGSAADDPTTGSSAGPAAESGAERPHVGRRWPAG